MKLLTSDTELHKLEAIEQNARGIFVTVPREALRHLLLDHIALNTEVLRKHHALPETKP